MDLRFEIKAISILFLFTLLFSYQKSLIIICHLAKNTDGSINLRLKESTNDLFEKTANSSIVSFRNRDGYLELKFLKSSINERDFFTYFSTGFFTIPEFSEIQFPDGVVMPIKACSCKIEETDLYFEIKIQ